MSVYRCARWHVLGYCQKDRPVLRSVCRQEHAFRDYVAYLFWLEISADNHDPANKFFWLVVQSTSNGKFPLFSAKVNCCLEDFLHAWDAFSVNNFAYLQHHFGKFFQCDVLFLSWLAHEIEKALALLKRVRSEAEWPPPANRTFIRDERFKAEAHLPIFLLLWLME